MRLCLVLLIISPIAFSFLLPPFPDKIHAARKVVINKAASNYPCNVNGTFNYAQTRFNEEMGITPETLRWKNVTNILKQLNDFMGKNDTNFLYTCAMRTQFYQSLGATYSACINKYWLLTQVNVAQGDDPWAPFKYQDMWSQLDFACNAGLQFAINNWYSIQSPKIRPGFDNCTNTFSNQVQSNPSQLCTYLVQFGNCLVADYRSVIPPNPADPNDNMGAWYWCEEARVSFNDDCPNVRCYVGGGMTPPN